MTASCPPPAPSTVLLTGVTGFVGQAVLERLLRSEARVYLLIRPRDGESGADRLDALLLNSAYDVWRHEVGPAGVARARTRLRVVEADLSQPLPPLPHDLDLVVHSASSVSFDAPWDAAIRANVLGPRHLYEALLQAGGTPHVVHVSTSYVNTDRTDLGLEAPVDHDVDWRAEVDAALTLRRQMDRDAGASVSTSRETSVDSLMKDHGRRRAHDLGWTDVYTMTKSLGERVAEELWRGQGRRLTVLRPTIIESALARPYPGWIDGFKVADPLIAAFAKGRLVAFPGHPDAVLDIVPVDVVVDAILAAAVVPHRDARPRYLQVGTGVSNPITLDGFRHHVETYVHEKPWTDRDGRPIVPAPWTFLAPQELEAWARRRSRLLAGAARALDLLPRRLTPQTRDRVATASRRLDVLRDFVEIYQPYSCSVTRYDDTQTRALLRRAQTRTDTGALDVTLIDWEHYLRRVHMPGLTRLAEDHRRRKAARARALPTEAPPRRRRRAEKSVVAVSA